MSFASLSIKAPKTRTVSVVGMTGASVIVAGVVPAGALLVGLTTRVGAAITGATGFNIGDGTTPNRWGDNIGVALNTLTDNTDWTVGTIEVFPATKDVILTAVGGNFTAGAVDVTAHYIESAI